jgi:hypothetical protein
VENSEVTKLELKAGYIRNPLACSIMLKKKKPGRVALELGMA